MMTWFTTTESIGNPMTRKPESESKKIVVSDDWSVPTGEGSTRRTIIAATAWTIPVVAVAAAAPLAAASTCVENGVIDWTNGFTRIDNVTGNGVTTLPSGKIITFRVSGSTSRYVTPGDANLTTNSSLGLSWGNVTTQASTTKDYSDFYRTRLDITFDTAVDNLAFTVKDVDGGAGVAPNIGWREYVDINNPTLVGTPGSRVNGPDANGRFSPTTDSGISESDPAGWIQYAASGPVTTFALRLTTPGESTPSTHGIWLSNMTFTVPC